MKLKALNLSKIEKGKHPDIKTDGLVEVFSLTEKMVLSGKEVGRL